MSKISFTFLHTFSRIVRGNNFFSIKNVNKIDICKKKQNKNEDKESEKNIRDFWILEVHLSHLQCNTVWLKGLCHGF